MAGQDLNNKVAVSVQGVSKIFTGSFKRTSSFKSFVTDSFKGVMGKKQPGENGLIALDNVDFEVKQGENFGIIGDNGAGKSTLLRILSSITEPTSGTIHNNGQVAAILDFGTGFHPELTGRENLYMNGQLLGMKRPDIEERFEEIHAFSEIHDLIDIPVKFYSNGIYLRLAISIILHLDAEILILDEIMHVGDASFRIKSYEKIKELAGTNKTLLLASHDLGTVSQLCHRVMLLEKGKVVKIGLPGEITNSYIENIFMQKQEEELNAALAEQEPEEAEEETKESAEELAEKEIKQFVLKRGVKYEEGLSAEKALFDNDKVTIWQVKLDNKTNPGSKELKMAEELQLSISYTVKAPSDYGMSIMVKNHFDFPVFLTSTRLLGDADDHFTNLGHRNLKFTFPAPFLNKGIFLIHIFIVDGQSEVVKELDRILTFKISESEKFIDKMKFRSFPGPLVLKFEVE